MLSPLTIVDSRVENPPPVATQPAMTVNRPRKGPWLQAFSPAGYEWNTVQLTVPDLAAALRGLRIVQLSDIHLTRRWWPTYDQIIERLRGHPPDLLFITGDFVWQKWDNRHAMENLRRFVEPLVSNFGIYAVLGNHDGDQVGPYVAATQVQLIEGETRTIDIRGEKVDLIGVPGASRNDPVGPQLQTLERREKAALRIAIAHYPDTFNRIAAGRPHLFFAGHTHGGQICLPNGFPPLTHDSLPRKYAKGIHRIDDTWFIVTRGLGYTNIPVRIFCPSEIIEVVLE
jgi:predicted MPP superfamily phosphohydrolase